MQNYSLTLISSVSDSYRAQRAANSVDLDTKAKSIHSFSIDADLVSPFNIGLIIGASGSGKTTFARHAWGDASFVQEPDSNKAIIDQFPESVTYDQSAEYLTGMGLASVPRWIRPVGTLSNGEKARAQAALSLALSDQKTLIIDEWTSVVDRTVAKAMSHCLQKRVRASDRRVVLLSCHYDVVPWLQPDWIVDCNERTYTDFRKKKPSNENLYDFRSGKSQKTVGRDLANIII